MATEKHSENPELTEARRAAFIDHYARGKAKYRAALAAGVSKAYASEFADRALADPDVKDAVIKALHANAASWERMLGEARNALLYTLQEEHWVENGGMVKVSERTAAAKAVLDALRTIDPESLVDKARREDSAETSVDTAKRYLGDFEVN